MVDDANLQLPTALATLSIGTDLANDAPAGSAMRTAHIGLVIARARGLAAAGQLEVFYATLLRFLGCTAFAHETSNALGGNDVAFHSAFAAVEMSHPGEVLRAALTRLAPGEGLGRRARAFVGTVGGGRALFEGFAATQCEVASRLAQRLEMNDAVHGALQQTYERWDGTGVPGLLDGDKISLVTRIVQVARTAELFFRERDDDEPVTERLRSRAGRALDPSLVETCIANFDDIVPIVRNTAPCESLLAALPSAEHPSATMDRVAVTFADFADLKSVYRIGHSHGVAEVAVAAGSLLGMDEDDLAQLRYAALLHDLGMVSVPTGILESRQPLSLLEQEKIRLHPYYTGRILALSPLSAIAKVAGGHHERADSSGYPAGVPGSSLPTMARVLAAADVYQALLEKRPHRDAYSLGAAEQILNDEVAAGRLDRASVGAILRGAGHTPQRANDSSILTGREIEVLRFVARGDSDKEIAAKLGISPRTVHHHVSRVYRKIEVSSRAAAALYAVEHGLLSTTS